MRQHSSRRLREPRRRARRLTCESLEKRLLLTGDLQVRFQIQEPDGDAVDTLVVGDPYELHVLVKDARAAPTGVLQAFFDVYYDSSLISVDGPVMVNPIYGLNSGGDVDTPGLIDEAGGVDFNRLPPDPRGAELNLFHVPISADQAGTLQLTADLSERAPNQPFFFGAFNAIRLNEIEFVGGTVEIVDTPSPKLSIAQSADASESGAAGRFVVSQSLTTLSNTVVSYIVGGTATSGQDFTALSGQVTIPAGQTSANINVSAINDAIVEASETVIVTLSSITGDPSVSINAGQNQATLNILDNDSAIVSVAATTQAGEAPGNDGVFTVSQSARSSTATNVQYTLSGTALPGVDYASLSGTATIPAGATATTIVIDVNDDMLLEGAEQVTVTLNSLSGDPQITLSPSNSQATLTIADNDTAQVRVAATRDGNEQDAVAGRFTVSLTRASITNTVIAYTLGGSALSGVDYVAPGTTVTIPEGSTTATIDITPINDAMVEGAENVALQLTSITSGHPQVSLDSQQSTATLQLLDDDTAVVSISSIANGNEAGPTAGRFRVTQSAPSASDHHLVFGWRHSGRRRRLSNVNRFGHHRGGRHNSRDPRQCPG